MISFALAAKILTTKSVLTCCFLMVLGVVGIFLAAMLSDPDKEISEVTCYFIYGCGLLVFGGIAYMLPISPEEWDAIHERAHFFSRKGIRNTIIGTCVPILSFILYHFSIRFMQYKRRQWAEEDRLKRSKGSRKKKSKG